MGDLSFAGPDPRQRRSRTAHWEGSPRILLVEDNEGDAELVRVFLEDEEDVSRNLSHVSSLAACLRALDVAPPDVVLLDLSLPDALDVEAIIQVRTLRPHLPIVVLTGQRDAALARRCVEHGAQDFVDKASLTTEGLKRAIGFALARAQEAVTREQLVHDDRLRSIGLLAAGVAHEINNPAAFVSANLESVLASFDQIRRRLESGHSAEEVQALLPAAVGDAIEAMKEAQQGVRRISTIVASLRSFARGKHEPVTWVELDAVVEDALHIVAHHLRQRAEVDIRLGCVPALPGYRGQLTQVVVNLLVNAAQAVEEIERDGHCIRIRSTHDGAHVTLLIEDTGVGMTADVQRRIFDPFYTTKPRDSGTGLGLSLSLDLVRRHGGRMTVTSTPNEGTSFAVRIPFETGLTVRPTSKQPPPAMSEGLDLRILVVDDEPLVLRAFKRALSRHADVQCACGALEALAVLAEDRRFDVILCDVTMPVMDGLALHAEVAQRWPLVAERFLFITGGSIETHPRHLGSMRSVAKPVDMDALLQELIDITRRARQQN
jgi:signal transduction histidine kinase